MVKSFKFQSELQGPSEVEVEYPEIRMFRSVARCCFVVVAASAVYAQTDKAWVAGTVEDQTGAAIPRATVSIKHINTNAAVQVTSDDAGAFTASALPVGP